MLTRAKSTYTWDEENRLLSVSNLSTAVVCNFINDHHSRRISKTALTPNPFSSLTSNFTYDGWNLISEVIDGQTTTSTNVYVWGLDLSGTLQGAGGVGGLLSQTVIRPTENISYFSLADANGNAVTYSDEAGNVQAHYTYDAFGNTVSQTGAMADDFPFRFSSKYLDDETGLLYYGFRFYDPALGRWLSRDPIEENGGVNIYNIAMNNSLGLWDVLGLVSYECAHAWENFEKSNPQLSKIIDVLKTEKPDGSYCKFSFYPSDCCPAGQGGDFQGGGAGNKKMGSLRLCCNGSSDYQKTIAHELVHFFDDCRPDMKSKCGELDVSNHDEWIKCNCAESLCKELRAYTYDGTCKGKTKEQCLDIIEKMSTNGKYFDNQYCRGEDRKKIRARVENCVMKEPKYPPYESLPK